MGKGREVLVLIWLVLILMLILYVGFSHGSRFKQLIFNEKPLKFRSSNNNNSPGFVNGFLPKALPVPPSGPSMKHNGIVTSQYHPCSP